jgi:hypothetical protein
MSETKQLTLPITGMTCANCVAAVERNIKPMSTFHQSVPLSNSTLRSRDWTIFSLVSNAPDLAWPLVKLIC